MRYHEAEGADLPHAIEVYNDDVERIMETDDAKNVNKWLKANIPNDEWEYNHNSMTFYFSNRDQAMHFLLVWG